MNKESVARQSSASAEQAPDASVKAKKKPDLIARVRAIEEKRAAEYQKLLERNAAEKHAENDNNRPPSPQEIILQQEAKRRRRIEMLNEMTSVDQELEMQNRLDTQSETYISQQLQTVEQSKQSLTDLEKKQSDMQASFFKRTFGRLFGGEKKLKNSLNAARTNYAEGRGLLEGAQDEYLRNKTQTVELAKRSEALHAEADQLDQEIAKFTSFEEKKPEEIQKPPEEIAREQLFEGMTSEELAEQRVAFQSERAVLETAAKEFEVSHRRLQGELQTSEQPLAALQERATQSANFLRALNMEHEAASQRLEDVKKRHQTLHASFWSRLVNKQEILTLEERIKEETVLLQGFDHHFIEALTNIEAMNRAPEIQVAQKKQTELSGQLNKLVQKQEMTRKRLVENGLMLTEVDLALNRARLNRPAAETPSPPGGSASNLRDRLRTPRRTTKPSNDQRLAA